MWCRRRTSWSSTDSSTTTTSRTSCSRTPCASGARSTPSSSAARWSRSRPARCCAMALDPQAANVIDLVVKSGRPPYPLLSPKEARRMFLETRPASTPPAPQIGAVRDVEAEGPLGAIPLRVYRPAGVPDARRLPAHVYFHGGGWVIGDIETHDVLCRQLTAEAGVARVSLDSPPAPGHKFPASGADPGAAARVGARPAHA